MNPKELARQMVGPVFLAVLGRKRLARLAHYLLNYARRDTNNNPAINGEAAVQQVIASVVSGRPGAVIFDIGANVGDWSTSLAQALHNRGSSARLIAVEPADAAFDRLVQAKKAGRVPADSVLVKCAFSSEAGSTNLYVYDDLAGINGLLKTWAGDARSQLVEVQTLDHYCTQNGINHISLVKIDTEGNDLHVLLGAKRLLRSHAIDAIQFEYNHRWIYAGQFLKNAFDLLIPLGYSIGKIVPEGVEFYPEWHPELESFKEANYLACAESIKTRFRAVRWWRA